MCCAMFRWGGARLGERAPRGVPETSVGRAGHEVLAEFAVRVLVGQDRIQDASEMGIAEALLQNADERHGASRSPTAWRWRCFTARSNIGTARKSAGSTSRSSWGPCGYASHLAAPSSAWKIRLTSPTCAKRSAIGLQLTEPDIDALQGYGLPRGWPDHAPSPPAHTPLTGLSLVKQYGKPSRLITSFH